MKNLAAVIVETRKDAPLLEAIEDHLKMLPEDTDIYVFTTRSFRFLKSTFPNCQVIEIEPITIDGYNKMLTSPDFWDRFRNDYINVLIFQTDSKLLRKGIEEFYNYDYVGAPWKFAPFVGNGGLSLRNPQAMYEVSLLSKETRVNEDVWICNNMLRYNIGKLAPIEVANKFSCETIFELGTLGYHAIDEWLTKDQCEQIKNQYK